MWEEEVERQGLHSHLLFEATPMAGLARELRAALGPGGGAQVSSVRVPSAQAGGRREGQGRGLDRGRGRGLDTRTAAGIWHSGTSQAFTSCPCCLPQLRERGSDSIPRAQKAVESFYVYVTR